MAAKFGQILATRADLIDEVIRQELSPLHDQVELTDRELRETITHAAHASGTRGLTISPEVLGAGSVAVVCRGELDGQPVAVKMLRPHVRHELRQDLRLLRALARLAARTSSMSTVPVDEVVSQVVAGLQDQLDLRKEADNLRSLAALASPWGVHVPEPIAGASSADILVTALVPGLERASWATAESQPRSLAAHQVMDYFFSSLFSHGVLHADMHPGNLYLTGSGPVLLDGGLVYRLDDYSLRSFSAFFYGFATGDGRTCAEVVWGVSEPVDATGPGEPTDSFVQEMRALIRHHHGLTAHDFSLPKFTSDLFGLQARHGRRSGPQFALPVLALLVVEGTIKQSSADMDFQRLAIPHLARATFEAAPLPETGKEYWKAAPATA
ncbi:AarF/UbiB family protein [Actinomycetota bacterium]